MRPLSEKQQHILALGFIPVIAVSFGLIALMLDSAIVWVICMMLVAGYTISALSYGRRLSGPRLMAEFWLFNVGASLLLSYAMYSKGATLFAVAWAVAMIVTWTVVAVWVAKPR